ncbi:MAG: mandelate racemase/muconate lactonizing enzyme family protein [Actinomycetia bacterium]|nr:mandelate racemase/muconate lactonizing enzyme family protein [Actinomycetes bacterium]
MTVEHVDLYALEVPPTTPLGNSQRRFDAYHYLVAVVHADDAVGYGWSYTQGVGGAVVYAAARDVLVPALLGADPWQTERIWSAWRVATYSLGLVGAVRIAAAALDLALWDLKAKAAGQSLAALLGGPLLPAVPAYWSSVNLTFTPEQLAEEAAQVGRAGFGRYKMKIGKPTLAEDLERIRIAQEAAGPGVEILVDANQAFSADEAVRRGRALVEHGVRFLEEPVPATDFAGYRRVAAVPGLTVAGGESLYQPEWLDVLAATGVGVIQPDLFRVGGITPLLPLLARAPVHGPQVALHCGEEIAVILAAVFPVITMVEHMPTTSLAAVGLVDTPLRVEDGVLVVPDAPGHGVVFDPARLRRFRSLV